MTISKEKIEYTADIFIEPKTCEKCKAKIRWIRTKKLQWMPIDFKLITIITLEGEVVKGFIPHWATCPNVEEFKKCQKKNIKK